MPTTTATGAGAVSRRTCDHTALNNALTRETSAIRPTQTHYTASGLKGMSIDELARLPA